MRLRNKKTREIIDLDVANIKSQFGGISVIPEPVKLGGDEYVYNSLAELCKEWKDYKPAEPLIKDENIRKAVRAWAEANDVANVFVTVVKNAKEGYLYWELASIEWEQSITIRFGGELPDTLEDGAIYSLEELCGKEEE